MPNTASVVRTTDDPLVEAAGTLLRQLVIATGAESVVVCGAGLVGFVAEALRENGRGRVVECEGGSGVAVPPGPVDLLVLGGAPERFLPVLRVMEPRMLPGAVVVACGVPEAPERAADFLAYVRASGSGYVSQPLAPDGGLEMAVRSA
ncbi:hypothetical protein [Streptomyces sp. FIT100]|uniref:hypothetical protein n=1 Tax=Streptomyces sp. FIT100 TaxID=2837956 RepID=UPI0021C61790|nr:hypothetical protein [Streptomyces sp. FIT100]UUN27434.1 hypothetical protein KK483_14255 [Streptomyces sp. FIT100]